jgi:hypothetical protein
VYLIHTLNLPPFQDLPFHAPTGAKHSKQQLSAPHCLTANSSMMAGNGLSLSLSFSLSIYLNVTADIILIFVVV